MLTYPSTQALHLEHTVAGAQSAASLQVVLSHGSTGDADQNSLEGSSLVEGQGVSTSLDFCDIISAAMEHILKLNSKRARYKVSPGGTCPSISAFTVVLGRGLGGNRAGV